MSVNRAGTEWAFLGQSVGGGTSRVGVRAGSTQGLASPGQFS